MVFASPIFLFLFLPCVLLIYYLINPKLRNTWLCITSFIFYAWGGVSYAFLMVVSIVVNYIFGLYVGNKERKYRRSVLVTAIIYNLIILGFFKYFNFVINSITAGLGIIDVPLSVDVPIIPLPIGISFYTFQILSYVVDVYRDKVEAQKNIINLGLYVMLFPQLIAGPIVRYIDIDKEIQNRQITIDSTREGLKRFILGLAKKVLIANGVGSLADNFFGSAYINTPMAWIGIIAYTLQIFFDFSGYSDMAIGLGRIFGFNFLENFNYPYISRSIQEFWRRWHISLSSWFKDYLYIPLGGNRKGQLRTYINSGIVFLCTGLWHGASWTFVIWGIYHGFFIIIEKLGLGSILKKIPSFICHIYTILVVMIGWVFFRADTLSNAIVYIKKLFVLDLNNLEYFYMQIDNNHIIALVLGIIFSIPIVNFIKEKFKNFSLNNSISGNVGLVISDCSYLVLFVVVILFVAGASFNPFIYFQF